MQGGYLRDRAGLTLIEMLVVLFIISLFAALVGPNLFKKKSQAQEQTAQHQMQILAVALDTYNLDVGDYPDSLEGLIESTVEKWNGPYLRPPRIPNDPWGKPYVYERLDDGKNFDLYTSTKDGKEIRYGVVE